MMKSAWLPLYFICPHHPFPSPNTPFIRIKMATKIINPLYSLNIKITVVVVVNKHQQIHPLHFFLFLFFRIMSWGCIILNFYRSQFQYQRSTWIKAEVVKCEKRAFLCMCTMRDFRANWNGFNRISVDVVKYRGWSFILAECYSLFYF